MALLMSRKLGVLVKSTPKGKNSLRDDIKRIVNDNYLKGTLSVKNSVSDIKLLVEFERRTVTMSVKVIPPLNKGTIARLTWIEKQLQICKKSSKSVFNTIEDEIWIEADIKYAKSNLKVKLLELDSLNEQTKGKEIHAFLVVLIKSFGYRFVSQKKFVETIEKMVLEYYEGIVQHMINWNRPAPKIIK